MLVEQVIYFMEKVDSLYDTVAHGEYEHREWLRIKIKEHFEE